MEEKIRLRLDSFRADIARKSPLEVVRKHITLGRCCMLSDEMYFDLKSEVATHFKIHPSEVMVVGSGKLGFSIAPDQRYRSFGDESDIDVAIVAPVLFDEIWHLVREYKRNGSFWPKLGMFCDYFLDGWIRPDMLPPSRSFWPSRDWWNFFLSLTSKGRYGPYQIRGALYRSWHHIESYQMICVTDCKRELELNP